MFRKVNADGVRIPFGDQADPLGRPGSGFAGQLRVALATWEGEAIDARTAALSREEYAAVLDAAWEAGAAMRERREQQAAEASERRQRAAQARIDRAKRARLEAEAMPMAAD